MFKIFWVSFVSSRETWEARAVTASNLPLSEVSRRARVVVQIEHQLIMAVVCLLVGVFSPVLFIYFHACERHYEQRGCNVASVRVQVSVFNILFESRNHRALEPNSPSLSSVRVWWRHFPWPELAWPLKIFSLICFFRRVLFLCPNSNISNALSHFLTS